jgi:hypothetical protein
MEAKLFMDVCDVTIVSKPSNQWLLFQQALSLGQHEGGDERQL